MKSGEVWIKAVSQDNEAVQDSCKVIVIQPVTGITLAKHSLTLKVGDAEQLTATVTPEDADNKSVKWSSSDVQVASVDDDGNVTALKSGEVWIKVVSQDNEAAQDSCKVVVTQPVTGVMLNPSECLLQSLGESIQLEATVLPVDATNKDVTWRSSNDSVCVVGNGLVIATGYGTTVVLVSTVDGGFLASCVVKVEDTTVIRDINNGLQNKGNVYDIMGRKVCKPHKGHLYIRNGQKFIAK